MINLRVFNSLSPTGLRELDLMPETMPNKECLIGRFPQCGLVLDGAEVSRLHGKISFQDRTYCFTDLGSRAGSWLNGENVAIDQSYPLKVGDIIRIGGFVLIIVKIELEDETTELSLSTDDSTTTTQDKSLVVNKREQPFSSNLNPIHLWQQGELRARCVRIIDETQDVKTFCFQAEPPVLFCYKPGQFVTLDLEISGEQFLHSYSLSSTPSRPHTLEITVKGATSSSDLVSHWLHENLNVGSEVKLNGPFGTFTCFGNPPPKILMVSSGIGITPMMSIARCLLDTASKTDIIFFHSTYTPDDIIFRQELELMSARCSNFHLKMTTIEEKLGQSWLGLTGKLDAPMLQIVVPDFQERSVYICGSNPFIEEVKNMLQELEFPMENWHEQSFDPQARGVAETQPGISNL